MANNTCSMQAHLWTLLVLALVVVLTVCPWASHAAPATDEENKEPINPYRDLWKPDLMRVAHEKRTHKLWKDPKFMDAYNSVNSRSTDFKTAQKALEKILKYIKRAKRARSASSELLEMEGRYRELLELSTNMEMECAEVFKRLDTYYGLGINMPEYFYHCAEMGSRRVSCPKEYHEWENKCEWDKYRHHYHFRRPARKSRPPASDNDYGPQDFTRMVFFCSGALWLAPRKC